MSTADDRSPWWRGAVIYQVYPRSFADGNGDGIGDIAGIRARLDHLSELGVDAIWLSPWYPSPMADAGYDVADYRDIDPVFGTLAEAEALIAEAHAVGIRMIVDIVPEPLLRRAPVVPGGAGRRPGRAGAGAVLVPARPRARRRRAADRLARRVRRHHLDPDHEPGRHARRLVPAPVHPGAARPQLGPPGGARRVRGASCGSGSTAGVDGIRIDSAALLIKDPALPEVDADAPHPFHDRDGVHEIYRAWRRVADAYAGDRALIGEVWLPDARAVRQLPAPGRAARRVQLRLPRLRLGRRALLRECIDATLARARAGRRAGHLGAVQPRRHPARHPVRPRGHHVQLRQQARRHPDRPGARHPPGPGRRAAVAWRCPAPPTSTRARSSASGRSRTSRTSCARTRCATASGGIDPGRDGCRVPLPVVRRRAAVRLQPGRRDRRAVAAAAGRRGRTARSRRRPATRTRCSSCTASALAPAPRASRRLATARHALAAVRTRRARLRPRRRASPASSTSPPPRSRCRTIETCLLASGPTRRRTC